jgi:hypothetical protein
MPVQVKCQYAVIAAVQVHKRARRVKGHAARIGYPRIPAERPRQFALRAKAENRAVAVAVRSAGTGDQDAHHDRLSRRQPNLSS